MLTTRSSAILVVNMHEDGLEISPDTNFGSNSCQDFGRTKKPYS